MSNRNKVKKLLEKDVQAAIMDYLEIKGIFAWVNKTQGTYDPKRGVFRKSKMKKGVSDILGIIKGRLLAIEVKRTGIKKGSPEQHQFIDDINSRGGIAFIADSVDVVREYI